MTIGVVFALDAEWAPWRSRHSFRAVVTNGVSVYEGTAGDAHIRVGLSGVGAPHVESLIEALCLEPLDALVVAGLAGALRETCVYPDVIVARHTQAAGSGPRTVSDARIVEIARRCGARPVDVLVSADRVIGGVAEKRRLAVEGDAVDMESVRVLDAARRRGIRCAAVRVIGDSADETLPLDFNRAVRPDGSVDVLNLAAQAAMAPASWPALMAFARRQRQATRTLAAYLDQLVIALAASVE